jgi:hypothetical protein
MGFATNTSISGVSHGRPEMGQGWIASLEDVISYAN